MCQPEMHISPVWRRKSNAAQRSDWTFPAPSHTDFADL
jgi:hypothetical protein